MTRVFLTIAALCCAAIIATSGCRSTPAPMQASPKQSSCAVPQSDRAWIDRAIEAWRFTSREITGIVPRGNFQAIFFSADCVLTSKDALSSPTGRNLHWTAVPHAGNITMPDGGEIPAGVTSFASSEKGTPYFVMSTPTVWRAGGKGDDPDFETRLIAVLLHEASHVAQTGPYGPRLGALITKNALPDSFNDDAVQERFRLEAEFAASVQQETELFLKAAATHDDTEARLMASEARDLMRARQARWYVGKDDYFAEAENIWLTFEGAGQWTGYQWLVHPNGGALDPATVLPRYSRGKWWSQTEGFALVMALDRIAGPGWKRVAYGDGSKTVTELLDAALTRR